MEGGTAGGGYRTGMFAMPAPGHADASGIGAATEGSDFPRTRGAD